MTRPFLDTLDQHRSGQSLPRACYVDPAFATLDIAAVWHRRWIFAVPACAIPEAGDVATLTIGDAPVVVLRGRDDEIRAFHNVCRHRGSVLVDAPRAALGPTGITCPYHQWRYALDGRLAGARGLAEDQRAMLRLRPVATMVAGGLVHVCLADDPPDAGAYAAALDASLGPHRLDQARIAHEITLDEAADWKLVMENSRECDHCAAGHPELIRSLLFRFDFRDPSTTGGIETFWREAEAQGLPGGVQDGPDWRVNRLPMANGTLSATLDGGFAVARMLGDLPAVHLGALRAVLYPSVFLHAMPDYAVLVRMLPAGPERTSVHATWLVHRDAVLGRDYDLGRLTEVWAATNAQDQAFAERNQRGVRSPFYLPGPYAPETEVGLVKFTDWYVALLRAHLSGNPAARSAA